MDEPVQNTTPPDPKDSFLLQEFWKETVKQADRMDDLAKELFKLEIAIPGLYATVTKLFADKGMQVSGYLTSAYLCWAFALVITLFGFFPKKYSVLEDSVDRVRESAFSQAMTIPEYFFKTALRKRFFLAFASVLFFIGIVCSVIAVFNK